MASSQLDAAEALLATVLAARRRVSILAHTHLPFDAALRIELSAAAGTCPARFDVQAPPRPATASRTAHPPGPTGPTDLPAPGPLPEPDLT